MSLIDNYIFYCAKIELRKWKVTHFKRKVEKAKDKKLGYTIKDQNALTAFEVKIFL